MLTYEILKKEDCAKLIPLYQSAYGRKQPLELLDWINLKNPMLKKKPYGFIAKNSLKEIVGYTAFIPMEYRCEDHVFKGALSAGSAVDVRASGIFGILYRQLEEQMLSDEFDFLFAFPNPNSAPFFTKIFGYQQYYFELLKGELHNFKNCDCILQTRPSPEILVNNLSETFVNWRLNQHPRNHYLYFENNAVKIAYKYYNSKVIDILFIDFKKSVCNFAAFIESLDEVDQINIYSTDTLFSSQLKEIGFKPDETANIFVYKCLNPALQKKTPFFQMIDSDIF